MIKKIAGVLLFAALLTSTPAMAATSATQAKAAPAIAAEILLQEGVTPTEKILNQVAREMGSDASFLGVKRTDPMYAHKVEHYLHCTLKVIEMPDHECMHGMTE